MKYLKNFNESKSDVRDYIKSEIDDVSYILVDDGLDITSFKRDEDYVVIEIRNSKLDISGFVNAPGYVPTPTIWDKRGYYKRNWLKSLSFDDSYIEFIDRVDEICKKNGYVIFVNGCSSKFIGDDEIVKYYNFDELYIATKNRPSNHVETFIDVKSAIKKEQSRANPGIVDKGIKWVGKKLNLI